MENEFDSMLIKQHSFAKDLLSSKAAHAQNMHVYSFSQSARNALSDDSAILRYSQDAALKGGKPE